MGIDKSRLAEAGFAVDAMDGPSATAFVVPIALTREERIEGYIEALGWEPGRDFDPIPKAMFGLAREAMGAMADATEARGRAAALVARLRDLRSHLSDWDERWKPGGDDRFWGSAQGRWYRRRDDGALVESAAPAPLAAMDPRYPSQSVDECLPAYMRRFLAPYLAGLGCYDAVTRNKLRDDLAEELGVDTAVEAIAVVRAMKAEIAGRREAMWVASARPTTDIS